MKLETWIYKQALELYPRAYREQFGQPMLETYTDSLRAAKLEGNTLGFHWNTVLDTIKSVSRATIEVKNADPIARVTAVLGLVLLVLLFIGVQQFPFDPRISKYFLLVNALYGFSFVFVGHYLYQMKHQWLMQMGCICGAVVYSMAFFVGQFYPSSSYIFYAPQINPYADTTMLVLGYSFKIIWVMCGLFFVIGIVLNAIEKKYKVLPMDRFTYSFFALALVVIIVDPQRQNVMLKFLMYGFLVGWSLLFGFLSLRLWQQPRAAPRVIKT